MHFNTLIPPNYMKWCWIFLFILSGYFSGLLAQEDTIKIKSTISLIKERSDVNSMRMWQDKSSIRISEKLDLYYDPSMSLPPKKLTFSFQMPAGKKRLIHSSARFILPAAFVSYGLIAQDNSALQRIDRDTHQEVSESFKGEYLIDDYLQFAPYAATYALDLCGLKAKHNIRDRTIVMTTSYLIMTGTVTVMKRGFGVMRPDQSKNNSFPSGHTATAFTGAHILYKEYKDVSPWIGISGYVSAASVGAFRIINKRHWVSDVIAGAGIGILSAEVSYILLPLFHNILGINESHKSIVIAPVIGEDHYGVGLACAF